MDPIYADSKDAPPDLLSKGHLPQAGSARYPAGVARISPLTGRDPFTISHRRSSPCRNLEARLTELESENLRLHRLVAELLIKNEQLRKRA